MQQSLLESSSAHELVSVLLPLEAVVICAVVELAVHEVVQMLMSRLAGLSLQDRLFLNLLKVHSIKCFPFYWHERSRGVRTVELPLVALRKVEQVLA